MKKTFVSVGLAAAGAASLHAAYSPDASDNSKLWNVSVTLRNFYDDNINTTHSNVQGSYGAELSPTFSLNVPTAQTEFGIRYTYGLYYYQQREDTGQDPFDQTHQFDLWLDHVFNPRWHMRVQDSFVMAQDPELLQGGTELRANGNNVANSFSIALDTDWTRLFGTSIGYHNSFYDFQNSTFAATPATPPGTATTVKPSLAGLLNRVEQTANIDLQWHYRPTTTFFVGYQYGQNLYIGNQPIYPQVPGGIAPERYSGDQDSLSHYGYVGVNHAFQENITGNARAGVQYSDNYADPQPSTSLGPYVDISLVDTLASGSYAQIGATYSRNATATTSLNTKNGSDVLDQGSAVLYGSLNYQVTSKLTASASAHFQYSTYNGGAINGQSDEFYNLGLNLNYAFSSHFSAEVGYNFDLLTSAVSAQSYTRDRYYIGLTGSY